MSLVRQSSKDTTERRLILNLSELEVAQLQEKIEDAKRQQWPKVIPKAAADTSLSKPKK